MFQLGDGEPEGRPEMTELVLGGHEGRLDTGLTGAEHSEPRRETSHLGLEVRRELHRAEALHLVKEALDPRYVPQNEASLECLDQACLKMTCRHPMSP